MSIRVINARQPTRCGLCPTQVMPGSRVAYDSETKRFMCTTCHRIETAPVQEELREVRKQYTEIKQALDQLLQHFGLTMTEQGID